MDSYKIRTVIWEDDGTIKAYNASGELVTKLTAKGLEELAEEEGCETFTLKDCRVKNKAMELPKENFERSVRAVEAGPVDRRDLPKVLDGVPIGVGDRILLVNQDKPHWDGVYRVVSGRSDSLQAYSIPIEAEGTLLLVERGNLFEMTVWKLSGGAWKIQP